MSGKEKAAARLKSLQYDFRCFTIDDFTAFVEGLLGVKIRAVPWVMSPGLFGAWLTDDAEDTEFIFYRADVPAIHQIHIRLHELAHMLLGHPTLHITRDQILESVGGKRVLPISGVAKLRSEQASDCEEEAETLASLIQEQVIRQSDLRRLTEGVSSNLDIAAYLHDLGLT